MSYPQPGAVARAADTTGQAARLSKRVGIALYRQVAEDLSARVARAELTPGERLAPEADLARQYGVNRLTVRRALEDLARRGIVRTEHGVGSFVAPPATRHRIDDGEASLSESMARRGMRVHHHVLAVTQLPPDSGTSFPDLPGFKIQFQFVRYLEQEPWSIGEVTLPASIAPRQWDGVGSVFAMISEHQGLELRRGEVGFSAIPASPEEAGWLKVPVGSPVLAVRGTNVDQHGRLIATFAHRIRGDRAEYVVQMPD